MVLQEEKYWKAFLGRDIIPENNASELYFEEPDIEGFIDRLLGGIFGLFKAVLVMGLVIMVLDMMGISDKIVRYEEKKQSQLYVPVSEFSGFCLQWTWNKVKENAEDLIPEYKKEDTNKDKKDQQKV